MTILDVEQPSELVAEQWQRVRARLRDEVGEAAYRSWLGSMTLLSASADRVRIGVPSPFLREWIDSHYLNRLRSLWMALAPEVRRIDLLVADQTEPDGSIDRSRIASARPARQPFDDPSADGGMIPGSAIGASPIAAESSDGDGESGAWLDPRYTFESFVVGAPNELAHAAARRVAEAAVSAARAAPFNPLFLHGGVGLGKTHLMHAIAWHIRRNNPARKVIYLSAETFMFQFVKALRYKDTVAFKDQFRSVDVLMVDDVQFISHKESTQEEFFHTFNALVEQNKQVVISADKSPQQLEGVADRMKSRLTWGLVADIYPTTYELRLGILQSKAEQRKAQVPSKVLEFLAHKITSNVRELEGALIRITAHSQLIGRAITLESVQDVLQDQLRANDKRVTIDEIQKRVAEHFNVKLADMSSDRRARIVARPRQVAMYLAKQMTPRSLPEIGRKFGGRDHTTVMHAVRKIEELMKSDLGMAEDVEMLRRMIES